MEASAVEILQHVTILGVEVSGTTVQVDLYGGATSACGTVTYHFRDADEVRAHTRTLKSWQQAGTDVTYLKRGDVVVLMDEVAYLREMYDLDCADHE